MKLEASEKSSHEVKCSWSDDVIRNKFIKSTSSEAKSPEVEDHQEMKESKLQRLFKAFNHA